MLKLSCISNVNNTNVTFFLSIFRFGWIDGDIVFPNIGRSWFKDIRMGYEMRWGKRIYRGEKKQEANNINLTTNKIYYSYFTHNKG